VQKILRKSIRFFTLDSAKPRHIRGTRRRRDTRSQPAVGRAQYRVYCVQPQVVVDYSQELQFKLNLEVL